MREGGSSDAAGGADRGQSLRQRAGQDSPQCARGCRPSAPCANASMRFPCLPPRHNPTCHSGVEQSSLTLFLPDSGTCADRIGRPAFLKDSGAGELPNSGSVCGLETLCENTRRGPFPDLAGVENTHTLVPWLTSAFLLCPQWALGEELASLTTWLSPAHSSEPLQHQTQRVEGEARSFRGRRGRMRILPRPGALGQAQKSL